MSGQQPFMGGSGPSQNDAILANQIRQRQGAGEPSWPAQSPETVERWRRRHRRRHLRKAIYWALVAVFFLIGGFHDLVIGPTSTSLGAFAVALVAAGWALHHLRSARPAS